MNNKNITKLNINQNMGEYGNYYKHYFGKTKFQSPLVSDTDIYNPNSTKKLV